MEEKELQHYGVIGMKWGVRRTPAQLGHAPKSERKAFKKQVRQDEKQWRKNRRETAIAQKVYKKTASKYQTALDVQRSATKDLTKLRTKMTLPWKKKERQEEIDRLGKALDRYIESTEAAALRTEKTRKKMHEQIEKTVNFVSDLNEKYGQENVKQMKYKTFDVGFGKEWSEKALRTGLNAAALPFVGSYLTRKQLTQWENEWQKELMDKRFRDPERQKYA